MIGCFRAQRALNEEEAICQTDAIALTSREAFSTHANPARRLHCGNFATVSVPSLIPSGSNPVTLLNSCGKKGSSTGSQMPPPARVAAAASRSTDADDTPPLLFLLTHHPEALLHKMPRAAVLFLAGAASGAIGKTFTAPLDRVKILMQVGGGRYSGEIAKAAAKGDILRSLVAIAKQDGVFGYWRGNLPQVGDTDALTTPLALYKAYCLFVNPRCCVYCPTAPCSCAATSFSSVYWHEKMARCPSLRA